MGFVFASRSWLRHHGSAVLIATMAMFLVSCGAGNNGGTQIQWIEGTSSPALTSHLSPGASGPSQQGAAGAAPGPSTVTSTPVPPAATPDPTATPEPSATPELAATATMVTGARLTADQLAEFRPNELGKIPVLEYHSFTTDPGQAGQFTRTIDDFRADLQWLYEHDFYVVPLTSVIDNAIAAPAGKHPVVLTFDDSTAGQFRYLIQDDGSVVIDPDSAIGVLEPFFAEHPDFGRGGFFAVLTQGNSCFGWSSSDVPDEPEQTPFCAQKLGWLLDHGYEVGNHTFNHVSLKKVDDDTFRHEIAEAIRALRSFDARIEANIMVMPFGNYPERQTRGQQRTWLKDGFEWDGERYRVVACLMVGASPTESPISVEFDPMFISRIQVFTAAPGLEDHGSSYWFPIFELTPELLYTSDGDPGTITVPRELPDTLVGTLDRDRITKDAKQLVEY